MNITIVCVGKLKETYWTQAVAEYEKRLGGYCSLTIEEIKEERIPDQPSSAEEQNGVLQEGRRILKVIKPSTFVLALEIAGKELDSPSLAAKLQNLGIEGKSDLTFLIGGSNGLSQEVLQRADLRLSFSKLTFPHQMMRVILLEQLYRSFKILRNEPYHK